MEAIDKIKIEDVPECNKDVAMIIGIESYKKLLLHYGGTTIYVPMIESVTRSVRNRILKNTFNGDYKASAKTFRISEAHVRRIINKK